MNINAINPQNPEYHNGPAKKPDGEDGINRGVVFIAIPNSSFLNLYGNSLTNKSDICACGSNESELVIPSMLISGNDKYFTTQSTELLKLKSFKFLVRKERVKPCVSVKIKSKPIITKSICFFENCRNPIFFIKRLTGLNPVRAPPTNAKQIVIKKTWVLPLNREAKTTTITATHNIFLCLAFDLKLLIMPIRIRAFSRKTLSVNIPNWPKLLNFWVAFNIET